MTGGKLYIKNEEVIELYKFFSNFEILPSLTERISKGDTFKFFIDIDEKNENPLEYYTSEEVKGYLGDIGLVLDECNIKNYKYILLKNNQKNKWNHTWRDV
jgi:hypothetical protein